MAYKIKQTDGLAKFIGVYHTGFDPNRFSSSDSVSSRNGDSERWFWNHLFFLFDPYGLGDLTSQQTVGYFNFESWDFSHSRPYMFFLKSETYVSPKPGERSYLKHGTSAALVLCFTLQTTGRTMSNIDQNSRHCSRSANITVWHKSVFTYALFLKHTDLVLSSLLYFILRSFHFTFLPCIPVYFSALLKRSYF